MPIPAGPIAYTVRADFSGTSYGGTPTWTDITQRVAAGGGFPAVNITKWRQDEVSDLTPTQVSLSLQNNDGHFTPGLASSPYYPNVRRRTRLQVSGTVASTPVYLADVFADSWEVARDGSAVWLSNFSGTDVLGRMAADTPLRSALIEEMLLDNPLCLYPLQEAAGAQSFGDVTNKRPPATVVNSKYGSGTVIAGITAPAGGFADGSTLVEVSNPSYPDTTGDLHKSGSWLRFPVALAGSGYQPFTLECWVEPSTTLPGSGSAAWVIGNYNVGAFSVSAVVINTSGHVEFPYGTAAVMTDTVNICDGNVHHIVGSYDGTFAYLYVDGRYVGSSAASLLTFGGDVTAGMWYASSATANPFTGAYGYVAVYDHAFTAFRASEHYHAGRDAFIPVGGFGAETADMRIARLLTYRTNFGSSLDLGDMVMGPALTDGMTLQAALFEAAQADGGVVFADGQGQIVFRARIVNYDPVAQLTLDASQKHVSFPTALRDDIQFMLNDVTVSRPGGADQRYVDTASRTQDGEAAASLTLNLDSDWEALQMAGWSVAVGRQEWVGVPSLTVDLMHAGTAVALAICQLQPLDMITLTNLPTPLPSSLNLQVQGVSLSLATDAQTATLFCSPVAPKVLRLDASPSAYTKLDSGLVFAA